MKYSRFGYLIGEGFSNVFKNKKSTVASLIIMCATMIIFGIFLIAGENINHFVDDIKSEQGFQVFLKNDATEEEIEEVGKKIKAIDEVATCDRKTKQAAYNQMKEKFGEKDYLMDEMDVDRFSESYVVTLTDLSKSKEVQDEILKFDNIKKITASNETVETLLNLANGIRMVTFTVLLLLIIISIFIISNTIKLTVHARRKEISIMKYVGATNSFIRWPFIVEGAIIGVMAGIISTILVGGAYSIIAKKAVSASFMVKMNASLVSFGDMLSILIIVYLLLGIGIGVFGSTLSMRKYLKV